MKQRLWPQCQSCWQQQGAAVKAGLHVPVYHWGLRLCHFAPAAAMILSRLEAVQDVTDGMIDNIVSCCDVVEKKIQAITNAAMD